VFPEAAALSRRYRSLCLIALLVTAWPYRTPYMLSLVIALTSIIFIFDNETNPSALLPPLLNSILLLNRLLMPEGLTRGNQLHHRFLASRIGFLIFVIRNINVAGRVAHALEHVLRADERQNRGGNRIALVPGLVFLPC